MASAFKGFTAFVVKTDTRASAFPTSFLGQELDEFLQLAVDKVEAGLSSGPCRSQAFTLLLWVRSQNAVC